MPECSIKGEDGLTLCIVGPQNAIDRVEQLVKENDRLRAALEEAAKVVGVTLFNHSCTCGFEVAAAIRALKVSSPDK